MNTYINDAHAAIWEAVKDQPHGDVGEALAVSLMEMLSFGNEVPDAEVTGVFTHAVMRAAALTVEYSGHLHNSGEFFKEFARVESESLAAFMLQLPWGDVDAEKPNKLLALEVAETFGPDYAQLLYRFAVLVTKLA